MLNHQRVTILNPMNIINQLHHHQHHLKKLTKTQLPASSRTSRINRFRWSLQFPASATISKSPSNFGIAKWMKKARTKSWKELNTQKKPMAWLLDCWTSQQKKHPNPKVTEDHRPILWMKHAGKKHAWNNHPVTNNTSAIPRNSLWQSVYR